MTDQLPPDDSALERALTGCLIGTAVGDALGLPAEGLKPATIAKRMAGPWRHRLIGRWGMCSDDTEHALLTVQALAATQADPERYRRALARRLRWWFAALPPGVGMATAKACLRLWLGWPSARAGVHSAGNGPLMRVPAIGVITASDAERRAALIAATTVPTHRDPNVLPPTELIADLAAACTSTPDTPPSVAWLEAWLAADPERGDQAWRDLLAAVVAHLQRPEATTLSATDDLAAWCASQDWRRGISGYSYHSAAAVAIVVLGHGDNPAAALEALYRAGGDTDTTGAIAGALLGSRHGPDCWPNDWLRGIHNGPLSLSVLRRAATACVAGNGPVRWWWPLMPLRNLWLLVVVLLHGFRRLVPI